MILKLYIISIGKILVCKGAFASAWNKLFLYHVNKLKWSFYYSMTWSRNKRSIQSKNKSWRKGWGFQLYSLISFLFSRCIFKRNKMRLLVSIRESSSHSISEWQKTPTSLITDLPDGHTHILMAMCSKSSFHVRRWGLRAFRNLPIFSLTTYLVYQNLFCGTFICPLSIWQLGLKLECIC